MAKAPEKTTTLVIDALKRGRGTFRIVGTTPMYFNTMSVKAKRVLLLGGGKKSAAQKREIKHNPEEEYRDSTAKAASGPTLLVFPATGVKNGMATAALVTDGVKKTDVQRLIFVPHEKISIWGKPYLRMDVVRSADMNRTPDIRTRAFLPRWCSEVDVAFVTPHLSMHSIAALLVNAGIISGLGDFRQEKGKGNYGTFRLLTDDPEDLALWKELTENEGRACQEKALAEPEAFDDDTRELWAILRQERMRRAA